MNAIHRKQVRAAIKALEAAVPLATSPAPDANEWTRVSVCDELRQVMGTALDIARAAHTSERNPSARHELASAAFTLAYAIEGGHWVRPLDITDTISSLKDALNPTGLGL